MYDNIEKKIKKANELLEQMREDGYGDLSVINLATEQVRKVQGTDATPNRFPNIDEIPPARMAAYDTILDKFTQSKWTTEEGRQEIFDKRLSTFRDNESLTKRRALQIYDIFDTDVYHRVIEKGLLDSKQVIDMVRHTRRGDRTARDFEQAFNALLSADVPEDESRIFVERFLKKR